MCVWVMRQREIFLVLACGFGLYGSLQAISMGSYQRLLERYEAENVRIGAMDPDTQLTAYLDLLGNVRVMQSDVQVQPVLTPTLKMRTVTLVDGIKNAITAVAMAPRVDPAEVEALRRSAAEAGTRADAAQGRVGDLETQLADAKAVADRLTATRAEMAHENEDLHSKLAEVSRSETAARERLQADLDQTKKDYEVTKGELDTWKAKHSELVATHKGAVAEHAAALQGSDARVSELEAQVANLQTELGRLIGVYQALAKQLGEYAGALAEKIEESGASDTDIAALLGGGEAAVARRAERASEK